MSKLYTAKSLASAQRRVRELTKLHAKTTLLLDQYAKDRINLAKLGATGPCFFNPLEVFAVQTLRDGILAGQGLNPDGSFKG